MKTYFLLLAAIFFLFPWPAHALKCQVSESTPDYVSYTPIYLVGNPINVTLHCIPTHGGTIVYNDWELSESVKQLSETRPGGISFDYIPAYKANWVVQTQVSEHCPNQICIGEDSTFSYNQTFSFDRKPTVTLAPYNSDPCKIGAAYSVLATGHSNNQPGDTRDLGDNNLDYRWTVNGRPYLYDFYSSFGVYADASSLVYTVQAVNSFGMPSDPVSLSVGCGGGLGISANPAGVTITHPDDEFEITVSSPANWSANGYFLEPKNNLSFGATFKTKLSDLWPEAHFYSTDYSLTATTTGDNPVSVTIPIHLVLDYERSFRLTVRGREYPYADCAPNSNDDCKKMLGDGYDSEFLMGDTVELDARGNNPIYSFTWTVQKLDNDLPSGEPIVTHGIQSSFSPIDAGDYEVKLNIKTDTQGAGTIVSKKIRISNSMTASFNPGAPFYMIAGGPDDLGYDWGLNNYHFIAKPLNDAFSSYGCTLVTLSNIFNRGMGVSTVRTVDTLFRRYGVYEVTNQINWEIAKNVYNKFKNPLDPKLTFQSQATIPYGSPPTDNQYELLESLGRKRQFASIVVHSLKVGQANNPNKNHFVLLNGIRWVPFESVTGKPAHFTYNIVDPANENRNRLDDLVYDNKFRALRYYSPNSIARPQSDESSITLSTSSPDIVPTAIFSNGKAVKISSAQPRGNRVSDVEALLTLEAVDSDDESVEGSIGGYALTLSSAPAGSYSFTVTANSDISGTVEIKGANSEDQLAYHRAEEITLKAGQTKDITINITNDPVSEGTLAFDSVSRRKDASGKRYITQIRGSYELGAQSDGFNLQAEESTLSLGAKLIGIEKNKFKVSQEASVYLEASPFPSNSVRYVEFQPNGKFIIEVYDIDLFARTDVQSMPISFRLGNDYLAGDLNRNAQISPKLLQFNFLKPMFVSGEHAEGAAYATVLPSSSEDEFFLKLKIDGADTYAPKIADNIWSIRTSKLSNAHVHSVSGELFRQNKRQARAFEASISNFNQEILKIDDKLKHETDSDVIQELTKKKQDLLSKIAMLEYNLEKSRTAIGLAISENFFSN